MKAKTFSGEEVEFTRGEIDYLKFQNHASGGFFTLLFTLIGKADLDNLERIHRGFPEQVQGFVAWADGDLAERVRKFHDDDYAAINIILHEGE